MKMTLACSMRERLVGLLGRTSFDGALLLTPCNDIHTFGMRGAIDVAFVAPDGTVLETYRSVPPNRRLKNKKASATVERFASEEDWLEVGSSVQHAMQVARPFARSYRR